MSQLLKLKELLENPPVNDTLLEIYLDTAKDIICDIRNTDNVESKYLNIQLRIAVELYNKAGAEGQTGHGENGINRSYEVGDISPSLLGQITPAIKTPFSSVKVVENEIPTP